jgi:hypothetical protein
VGILFPIQDFDEPSPPLLTLSGETTFALSGAVQQASRLRLSGGTALTLRAVQHAALALSGQTSLSLHGPQVQGGIHFTGATALSLAGGIGTNARLQLAGGTALALSGTQARAEEFGFTFFVDILSAALAASGNIRRYRSRLAANGVEVLLRSAVESAPRGAMGVSLSLQLAAPDPSLVPDGASLAFDIGVWDGEEFDYLPVLSGGRLAGRSVRYANADKRPADTVSVTTLDALGDRWTLAPPAPVTLYDPEKTDAPAVPDARNLIHDERGRAVIPVNTPRPGLTLRQALVFAYVGGCGFSSVVTNLPDFPVARADFTLEAGWHGGASPLVAAFDPLYFAGDNNSLWIVDPDAPLPAGLSPIVLSDAEVSSIDDTLPARSIVNALVVTYTEDTGGNYYTERLEQETTSTGRFGARGYTSTETTRRVREWRNFAAPETVIRESVVSVESETSNADFEVVASESQVDHFDALGRKSGHTREQFALVPDLSDGGNMLLQRVTSEVYSIYYRGGSSGDSDEIARNVTEQSGLVLIDSDKPYLGRPYELPLVDAHRSGYVDPDANQGTEFRAIRTTIESYVREGASVEARKQTINFLNGQSAESSQSQTRAGSIAVNRRAQGQVRRLLTVAGGDSTDGRIIPTLNAGDVPGALALELGRRKLARLNSPPRNVSIQIPYLDFRVRRGVIVEARGRGGVSLGVFIVEGYTRNYNNLSEGGFTMSLQAREVKS